MKSPLTTVTLASLFAATSLLQAEEGGAGHYVPGSLSTLIDLPPSKPGWVIEAIYLNYQGDATAGNNLPIGGLLTANIDATSDAFMIGGFHTFENQLGGAWYSIGAFVPYVWMDVSATIIPTGGGPTFTRNDREDGIGDITLLPLLMAWKCDEWQFSAALPVYTPTGDYEVGNLANPGRNYWTFDPTVGVSYNNETTGFNAALHTGITINTENDDTNYRSGSAWHTELSVQQLLPLGPGFLGVGFNAWFYDQITGDSGSGALLGDFEGRSAGIGPVLTYILPVGDDTFVGEVRWMPELETRRRLEGDYVWAKFVYQF